jgi:hypothetical protein
VITGRLEVMPHVLLQREGGSVAAAMRITGNLIQELTDAGATSANGMQVRASWIAITLDKEEALGSVEWDPQTPIPPGTVMLRCTAYSVPLEGP